MKRPILIVTGQSGSGKSLALRALEDRGYTAMDNIPVPMIGEIIQLELGNDKGRDKLGLALGIDGRGREYLSQLPDAISALKKSGYPVTLLYLEASDDVLLARYRFTRRRHPFGFKTMLLEGIQEEKKCLLPLRSLADRIIDTTLLDNAGLTSLVLAGCNEKVDDVQLLITSFGFKYGNPRDADYLLDVRFLANPYYDPALKEKSGLDDEVAAYIYNRCQAEKFLLNCYHLFAGLLPHYPDSGKSFLHLAVGCTGGRHRSVFTAQWLAQRLDSLQNVTVTVRHRDLER